LLYNLIAKYVEVLYNFRMSEKKKNLILYLNLSLGVVIIIAAYILIYFAVTTKGYLYFENLSMKVDFGAKYSLEELGLNSSININDVEITCDRAIYKDGYVYFNKAGKSKVFAKSDDMSAKLQVDVEFDSIDEYFDIYANVGNDRVLLNGGSEIDLYLPSLNRELAEAEGYINKLSIDVVALKTEDNYEIKTDSNLFVDNNVLYSQNLGRAKVYIEFETFGKSFDFFVNVKEIGVQSLTSGYAHNTMYVDLNERFEIDIIAYPSYATNKDYLVTIEGSAVEYNDDVFISREYGKAFVTFGKDFGTIVVEVVVCYMPDEMKVDIISDFVYGEKGRATINFYKDKELVDSDYQIIYLQGGVEVDGDALVVDAEIKYNVFSAKIISKDSFVIKVLSNKNSQLSFEIYVNN